MSKIETVKLLARQTAEQEKNTTEETRQFREYMVWGTETIRKGIDTTHSNQKVILDFLQQHLPVRDNTTEIVKSMNKALDLIIREQKRTQWIWMINFITLSIPIAVLTISLVIYCLIHQ